MKRFIRSIARTMGLAALVSMGGAGCRFDLDSLRKDGGVQIADSGMKDSMLLVDGNYADGKEVVDAYTINDVVTMPDAGTDAQIIPDAVVVPDAMPDMYVPPPDANIADGYVLLPDALFQDALYLPDAVVPDAAYMPDAFTADAPLPDAALPDASPGGILPSSEFTPDQHCLALYHFNLPNYTESSCGSSLQDNGSSSTDSLAGFHEARFFEGGRMTGSGSLTTDLDNRVTVEALIKPSSETSSFLGGFGNIFHTVYTPPDIIYQGFALFIMNGALAFNIGLNEGFLFSVTGPASFPTTTYTHIAGTYDGLVGRIFINGIVIGEAAMSGTITPITNTSQYYTIGSDIGGNNSFLGAIDEVRVSNTVRYGPSACYFNDFNEDSDLENLVIQNGTWVRDQAAYLKQTEATPILQGYRMSYLSNAMYSNLDATVKVRVPGGFTSDAHTGLLFRYSRNSQSGYDYSIDKGYILDIENGTGTTFDLTLEDAYISRIHTLQVQGSFDTWHTLRVRAIGDTITAYFNDQEMFTLQNSLYTSGHIGFGSHASVSHFDDLEVCPLE